MSWSLAELVAKRDLLYMLTWRDIRLKYKQSVMGMLWAILMPAVIVSAGIVVRVGFSVLSGRPLVATDVASVSVRAVPWAFFVSSIRFATVSLVANSNLVTKISLPREIFPVAAMLSQLMDFAVASLVLVIVLTVLHAGASIQILWLPGLIVILVVLTTGLGILLSAASLFFRDVKYLVEVILTFAIFFTPVFYEASMFGRWAPVLMLNPVAPLLEGIADVVVRHTAPPLPWVAYSAFCAVGIFAGAVTFFHRFDQYFAESA
jgi:ABC-type polysaccharide/polyol phosphate export permease